MDAPAVFVLQGAPTYDPTRPKDVPRSAVTKAVKEAYYDSGDVRVVVKRRTGVVIYVAEPDHYVVGDMAVHLRQASNVISASALDAANKSSTLARGASGVLKLQLAQAVARLGGNPGLPPDSYPTVRTALAELDHAAAVGNHLSGFVDA